MFTYEWLLLAALFSCPSDELQEDAGAWADLARPSVMALSIDAEILDSREREHYFTTAANREGDLAFLRMKYRQLVNCPGLEDANRFPSRQAINDFLSFNRALRGDLQKRLAVDQLHAEEIRLAILVTDQHYQVWDTLRDARCHYYYVTVRRQALQNLLEMIGPASFYSGVMPPHVPVELFPRPWPHDPRTASPSGQ